MKLDQCDTKKLSVMLDQLANAIEELLLTGLTTASDATVQTLNISFQEASRAGLLRLGSTLRVACEELTRYTKEHPDFSAKRFCFFLNRSWLLSKGLSKAIKENDREEFERLTWNAPVTPVQQLEVVTLGVSKKYVPGAFCAFEFRMRSVAAADAGGGEAAADVAADVAAGRAEASGSSGSLSVPVVPVVPVVQQVLLTALVSLVEAFCPGKSLSGQLYFQSSRTRICRRNLFCIYRRNKNLLPTAWLKDVA